MANYFWQSLTTREVECSKLTEQEFVNLILDDIKSASTHYEKLTNGDNYIFFDLDVEPYQNGISSSCILDTDTDEEKARSCFKEIKDKKYFLLAKGWEFRYETREGNNYKSSFRPEIKLIFDPEVEQQYKNDEKKLADDIARFYADCRYCGD